MKKYKNSLSLAGITLAVITLICATAFFEYIKPSKPIEYHGKQSIILTNTAKQQLTTTQGWQHTINPEQYRNPYTFGWEGNTLYYKDAWGQQYKWTNDEGSTPIQLENPQFFRQTWTSDACDDNNKPEYSGLSDEVKADVDCRAFVHEQTKVEIWPDYSKNTLWLVQHVVIIQSGDTRIVIKENRNIADVAISEDGKYVALTASKIQKKPSGFTPTDIHVLELR